MINPNNLESKLKQNLSENEEALKILMCHCQIIDLDI